MQSKHDLGFTDIAQYHCLRWAELPDLALYMDQVLTILEKQLCLIACGPEDTSGTPADGYEYLGCSSEPASVQVCGKEEALSQIESINIPASELSIDGATEKIEKAFDITDYLPEGVELIEGASGKVTATAMIEQLGNRTIEFMVASIKQNYLGG